MNSQIKVAIIRVKKSMFFYFAIIAFIILAFMSGLKAVYVLNTTDSGIDAFLEAISDTSLILVLSMLTSYIVGDEFTNRTIDNEIRIGYSRFSIILSRAIVVLPFSLVPYLAYTVTSALILGIANGFSTSFTVAELVIRLLLFLLQLMSIQSMTLFIVFVCKKASLGMMVSVGFSFITCNILRNFFEDGGVFFRYTSFYRIMTNRTMMDWQDILRSFILAVGTVIIMVCITYFVFRKAELK